MAGLPPSPAPPVRRTTTGKYPFAYLEGEGFDGVFVTPADYEKCSDEVKTRIKKKGVHLVGPDGSDLAFVNTFVRRTTQVACFFRSSRGEHEEPAELYHEKYTQGESRAHCDAKRKLAGSDALVLVRQCGTCGCEIERVELDSDRPKRMRVEHRVGERWLVDAAEVVEGQVQSAFEVYETHPVDGPKRDFLRNKSMFEAAYYEVRAEDVLQATLENPVTIIDAADDVKLCEACEAQQAEARAKQETRKRAQQEARAKQEARERAQQAAEYAERQAQRQARERAAQQARKEGQVRRARKRAQHEAADKVQHPLYELVQFVMTQVPASMDAESVVAHRRRLGASVGLSPEQLIVDAYVYSQIPGQAPPAAQVVDFWKGTHPSGWVRVRRAGGVRWQVNPDVVPK